MKKFKKKSSPSGEAHKKIPQDKAFVVCYIQKIRELLDKDEAVAKKAAGLISNMIKNLTNIQDSKFNKLPNFGPLLYHSKFYIVMKEYN